MKNNVTHYVVYNDDYGGFGISRECAQFMADRGCPDAQELLSFQDEEDEMWVGHLSGYDRHDALLVLAVKELGPEVASARGSKLAIHKLKGNSYYIDEYDGAESIVEPHSMQWIKI